MSDLQTEREILGSVLDISGDTATCRLSLSLLGQLRQTASAARRAASSVGGHVKIEVAQGLLLGTINEINSERNDPAWGVAHIDFLGEGANDGAGGLADFRRGITVYPQPGDTVRIATQADLMCAFSPDHAPHIEVGTIYPTTNVRASILFDKLLSRHFAVLGATGTGKSTAMALMLHRIIQAAPASHVVMLDPHGEYASAFRSEGQIFNVNNLQIPYWVMNLAEHCEAFITTTGESRAIDTNIMAKCLLSARAKNHRIDDTTKITADSPIPYLLNDLYEALQEEMSRLDKQADAYRYIRLKLNIEQFFADRRFGFIFNPHYRHNSMTKLIGEVLRIPVQDKPISIIDLAGVPSEIVKVVVSTLSRLIFDYAVWAPREKRIPILLVCEEAQRYLPAIHPDEGISAEHQLERIAREGRKYGVSLGLVTQRPSELSQAALSQCGTVISMRLNNVHDQMLVRDTLPEGARSFVDILPALQNRECIICGEGVPIPVRVRLDTLEDHLKPASEDPVFSELWGGHHHDEGLLTETVSRWRGEEQPPQA